MLRSRFCATLLLLLSHCVASDRSNFCDVHREVESGNETVASALKGVKIQVAFEDYQLDENGQIRPNRPGIAVLILDELAERAGFSFRNSYGVVRKSGNKTWTNHLWDVLDSYDLMGEWFWRDAERLEMGIVFPEHWHDGSLVMVTLTEDEEDQSKFDMWALFRPFTWDLWVLIICNVVLSTAVFHAIQKFEGEGLDLDDSLFLTSFSFTSHYFYDPKSNATRLFSFSVCFVALVVAAIYTANLTNVLITETQPENPINSIADAVTQNKVFCVLQGSTSYGFLALNFPFAAAIQVPNVDEEFSYLDRGECDVAIVARDSWESAKGSILMNRNCRKEWIGRTVQFLESGFSLRDSASLCSSLLRDVLNVHMVAMKRDGKYAEIMTDYRKSIATQNCDLKAAEELAEETEGFHQMSAKNVGGLFILHWVFLCLAALMSCRTYWMDKKLESDENAAIHNENQEDCKSHDLTLGVVDDSGQLDQQNVEEEYTDNFALGYSDGPIHPVEWIGRAKKKPTRRQSQVAFVQQQSQSSSKRRFSASSATTRHRQSHMSLGMPENNAAIQAQLSRFEQEMQLMMAQMQRMELLMIESKRNRRGTEGSQERSGARGAV